MALCTLTVRVAPLIFMPGTSSVSADGTIIGAAGMGSVGKFESQLHHLLAENLG